MRDIRFRAWDKAKGEMQSWDYLVVGCNASRVLSWMQQEDKNKILMQYTGLKDKNGKEIYEGDILEGQAIYNGDVEITKDAIKDRGFVEFWENCGGYFLVMDESGSGVHLVKSDEYYMEDEYIATDKLEIIGNLYENPELLKL